MKAALAYLALGLVTTFSTTSALADLLVYEPFDYASGSAIIGQTDTYSPNSPAWVRAGTAATTVHHVISPSLTGPSGFPASIGNAADLIGGPTGGDYTEYARMSLGSEYGPGSSLYYSLLLNVPATSGLTTANSNANANNDGIIAFNNVAGAGIRPNTWSGELAMRLGSTANTFDLGVRASTTATGTTYWSADLTPGQTYLVVVGYTASATAGDGLGVNSLWINPDAATLGAAMTPSPDGTTQGSFSLTAANDHADSLILGAGVAAGADPSQTYVDEIRIGTTWADVTTVPEPSTLALVGFGALGLLCRPRARRR